MQYLLMSALPTLSIILLPGVFQMHRDLTNYKDYMYELFTEVFFFIATLLNAVVLGAKFLESKQTK